MSNHTPLAFGNHSYVKKSLNLYFIFQIADFIETYTKNLFTDFQDLGTKSIGEKRTRILCISCRWHPSCPLSFSLASFRGEWMAPSYTCLGCPTSKVQMPGLSIAFIRCEVKSRGQCSKTKTWSHSLSCSSFDLGLMHT